MTAPELLALAERCEAATGPDREIDHDVAVAVGAQARNGSINIAAYYTASIDAAMMLVPEWWAIERWQIWPGQPSALRIVETHLGDDGQRWHGGKDRTLSAQATTPALAIAAAAIRARAAQEGGA